MLCLTVSLHKKKNMESDGDSVWPWLEKVTIQVIDYKSLLLSMGLD